MSNNDKSSSSDGKEYILCHIRKIDSNYKISKGGSKKMSLESYEG